MVEGCAGASGSVGASRTSRTRDALARAVAHRDATPLPSIVIGVMTNCVSPMRVIKSPTLNTPRSASQPANSATALV